MKNLILVICICLLVTGCFILNNFNEYYNPQNTMTKLSDKTSVVVVGLENSKTYGKCIGSGRDAINMTKLFSNFTTNIVTLIDSDATIKNFSDAVNDAVKNDLAIIYYSGHGGSFVAGDELTKYEIDGVDEFLCLYDGGYRDDNIWNLIIKSKGRVMLIFDCCHSATMFRTTNFKNMFGLVRTVKPNMLCWSGCPDNTYSYGDSFGGKFTNTILKYFKFNLTYNELWNLCINDESLKSYEIIQMTSFGDFDLNEKCFK